MIRADGIFFDSNVFINSFRSQKYSNSIESFLQGSYLFMVSEIVLMELWSGVRTKEEEEILKSFLEFPLMRFSSSNFLEAGKIMKEMKTRFRLEPRIRRRLTWDILIALSAVENNAILVTENVRDFDNIKKFLDFEMIPLSHGKWQKIP